MIMALEDKDAALFPHRIGGQWALIHRPVGAPGAHMCMFHSPDLRHWGMIYKRPRSAANAVTNGSLVPKGLTSNAGMSITSSFLVVIPSAPMLTLFMYIMARR